jgi:hypothetical protein
MNVLRYLTDTLVGAALVLVIAAGIVCTLALMPLVPL